MYWRIIWFKHFILLFFLSYLGLLVAALNASEQPLEGEMYCNVEALALAKMAQGKHTSYSGYKDGIKKDDELKISYQYRYGVNHEITFLIEKASLQPAWDNIIEFAEIGMSTISNCSIYEDEISISYGYKEIKFGKDRILYRGASSGFFLNRYYKSDWEGFYWAEPSDLSDAMYTVAFQCKHGKDSVDKIVNGAFSSFGKNTNTSCEDILEEKFGTIKTEDGPTIDGVESIKIFRRK